MPLFDAHAHFFPDKLFQAIWNWFQVHGWPVKYQIQANQVVGELKASGVKRFIVLNYAHKPGMSRTLNAWTQAFSQKHPEAVPFGAFHPEDSDLSDEMDRCFKDYNFPGMKFHCHVTAIRPDDERLFPAYEKLVEQDRYLTLHAGTAPSLSGYKAHTCQVSGARYVRRLLKKFPTLKLIIPHLGAEEFEDFFDMMGEYPQLLMDTTMACAGYFKFEIPWKKIEEFSDRILYG